MKFGKLFAAAAAMALAAGFVLPAASQEPLRIGLLDDMSSVYTSLGGKGTALAIEMAIEDFGGNVGDRAIEFTSADHLNQPDLALSLASAWLERDNYDLILGGGNSAALLAVQNMMKTRPHQTLIVSGSSNLDIAGKSCTKNSMQFAPNNYILLAPTIKALTDQGDTRWYLLSSDNAGGKTASGVAERKIQEFDGEVVGKALFPLDATDFSSYLLQVQASGAQVAGLSTSGSPLVAIVKQAREFQLPESGLKMALLAAFITDIHSLGLETSQDLVFSTIFYWARDEKTREWSKRFYERHGGMPTQMHAAAYAATTHYLQAAAANNSSDAEVVVPAMKEMPINNILFESGSVREDGAAVWPAHIVSVKSPDESEEAWDYYEILTTVPADEANLTMEEQGCPGFSE
jgi:branched-chain amino acid transport system substrate-binding protein